MTQEELDDQVRQASEYLIKPKNQGFEFWLKSKGLNPKDEEYVRCALGYEND